MILKHLEREI